MSERLVPGRGAWAAGSRAAEERCCVEPGSDWVLSLQVQWEVQGDSSRAALQGAGPGCVGRVRTRSEPAADRSVMGQRLKLKAPIK